MNDNEVKFSNESDINNYIKLNQKSVYNDLTKTWRKNIEDSNNLLNDITSEEKYIENNINEVEETLETLNSALDYYSELRINFDSIGFIRYGLQEMRRNLEKNYRLLSFKYYQYMFEKNKVEIEKSVTRNNDIEKKIEETEEKINNMDNRVENLGGTFLNIVLTISIVSSMVAVLLNTKPSYAISIVLTCAWLLLSSILFISEYYKKNENYKFGKKIYIILTIVTFISYIPYCINFYNNHLIKLDSSNLFFTENSSDTQYIIIENQDKILDFLNSFSTYWKENDKRYVQVQDILIIDNISKIIFYKYTNGNIDFYRYEILLSNDSVIVFEIKNEDLKNWLNQNGLIIK